MRLTLRNLLAYLHEMMSPDDRATFAELVAKSQRVQQLLERCRAVARRHDLAAPALEQATEKHAADTVGKYLDFELPDAQLATFERAALESDEQLAEIVACHRVLADIVAHRVPSAEPAWKERIVALPGTLTIPSQSNDESSEYVLAGPPEEVAAAGQEQGAAIGSLNGVATIERSTPTPIPMQDSGELLSYLDPEINYDDDDDVVSEEAARARSARKQHDQAVKTAAGPVAPTQRIISLPSLANHGVRDAYKDMLPPEPQPPLDGEEQKPEFELAVPLPVLIGGGAGGLVALCLLGWLVIWMFSGPAPKKNLGPHVYGIEASPEVPTVELAGTVLYLGGPAPSPDVGAIVVSWPVGKTPVTQLTTVQVTDDLAAKRQSPYNDQLVVAKADDDGRYAMRMHEHTEFHVLIMSQRSLTTMPKTWGEGVQELKVQVSDPASLVGQHVYHYEKIVMPAERKATLDHTFEPAAK